MTKGVWDEWNQLARMVPIANEAGIGCCPVTTTACRSSRTPSGAWSADFATYVDQVGIKPLDTLRWATRNMASLMEMEGQLGTIAPEALADLVVLRDDPSDDVTILQDPAANVLAVLKDGEFVVNRLPSA